MNFLIDTHLLLWAVEGSSRMPKVAFSLLKDPDNGLFFSAASIWEFAIKYAKSPERFGVSPIALREALLQSGYVELPVHGKHAVAIANLPPLHSDPFDRLLIAQSAVEGITLLTSDAAVARYPGHIQKV